MPSRVVPGFYDMVQFAIKRFGQNQLQVAISAASSDGWTKDAVNQYLYALKAKLTCVAGPFPHLNP